MQSCRVKRCFNECFVGGFVHIHKRRAVVQSAPSQSNKSAREIHLVFLLRRLSVGCLFLSNHSSFGSLSGKSSPELQKAYLPPAALVDAERCIQDGINRE